MNQTDIERLKKIQIDMLAQFIKICDKYSLKYYIIGGTCLGAVRHQGFIPWDDDIDVGMPAPNYVEENVSTKVVKIIQSYTGVVNKMVWRKF